MQIRIGPYGTRIRRDPGAASSLAYPWDPFAKGLKQISIGPYAKRVRRVPGAASSLAHPWDPFAAFLHKGPCAARVGRAAGVLREGASPQIARSG